MHVRVADHERGDCPFSPMRGRRRNESECDEEGQSVDLREETG